MLWGHLSGISEMAGAAADGSNGQEMFSHTYEIVASALNGSFDLHQTNFNHAGYEAKSAQHSRFNANKGVAKELNIVDSVMDEDSSRSYGTVKDTVLVNMEEAFDQIEASVTIRRGIVELVEIRERLFKKHKLDIITALKESLGNNPGAIEAVKEVCESTPDAGELIVDILQSVVELSDGEDGFDLGEMLSEHL